MLLFTNATRHSLVDTLLLLLLRDRENLLLALGMKSVHSIVRHLLSLVRHEELRTALLCLQRLRDRGLDVEDGGLARHLVGRHSALIHRRSLLLLQSKYFLRLHLRLLNDLRKLLSWLFYIDCDTLDACFGPLNLSLTLLDGDEVFIVIF